MTSTYIPATRVVSSVDPLTTNIPPIGLSSWFAGSYASPVTVVLGTADAQTHAYLPPGRYRVRLQANISGPVSGCAGFFGGALSSLPAASVTVATFWDDVGLGATGNSLATKGITTNWLPLGAIPRYATPPTFFSVPDATSKSFTVDSFFDLTTAVTTPFYLLVLISVIGTPASIAISGAISLNPLLLQ